MKKRVKDLKLSEMTPEEVEKISKEVIESLAKKHKMRPIEPTDRLDRLFHKQEILQERLKNTKLVGNQEFINTMTLAAIDELMEALRETPWKPWKKQQKFNQNKFKGEIIDLWHFIINLSLAAGFNSKTLFEAFEDKNIINHQRQDKGY